MTIDEILSLWKEDSIINKTELGDEAIKIANLIQKYYDIFIHEKKLLLKYESEYKTLKLEKYEFYTQGHNEYTIEKGWELPAKGVIIKSEISLYMDADKDLINFCLKIGIQKEKVEMLEFILKSFNNRGYNIRAAIDDYKIKLGI